MKRNRIIYIATAIISLMMTGCINDLNVIPIDPNTATADKVFVNEDSYKQALAKLYGSFALYGQNKNDVDISGLDGGFSNYIRLFWNTQELSTDEAMCCWNDGTIKDLHYQTWTASTNEFVRTFYSRIFLTISYCNEFIRTTNDKIPTVTGSYQTNLKIFNAEARFIRAFAYYHAIDNFGNVPFVTEADKPGSFSPKQIKRADLFTYIETELKAIETELAAPKANEYGRVDQVAAQILLAKLYLNAKVYTGTERNTDAITYLNKVIASPYTLDPSYKRIFCADNNESPEIIFPICFDGINTQDFGTTFIIASSLGGGMPVDESGFGLAWGGNRAIKEFVKLFDITESDISATDFKFSNKPDKRGIFYFNPAKWTWEISNTDNFTEGIGVVKFKNVTSTGGIAENANTSWSSTDFPFLRTSDAYLMYAEAVLRGGTGGSKSQALAYINALRERAYGNSSGDISDAQLTLDFILDERGRELYWEGYRRSDLIRFGKFTGDAYVWQWKGKVQAGVSTESYRDLYPIPDTDIMANLNLKQNEGYK
jgi:starch-binding outer membrane protein, SusD/RagB family